MLHLGKSYNWSLDGTGKKLKAGDLNFHRHHHWLCQINPYILKAKKFAEPPFQSKKIAEKVHKLWRQF